MHDTGPSGYTHQHAQHASECEQWACLSYCAPPAETITLEISALYEGGARKSCLHGTPFGVHIAYSTASNVLISIRTYVKEKRTLTLALLLLNWWLLHSPPLFLRSSYSVLTLLGDMTSSSYVTHHGWISLIILNNSILISIPTVLLWAGRIQKYLSSKPSNFHFMLSSLHCNGKNTRGTF